MAADEGMHWSNRRPIDKAVSFLHQDERKGQLGPTNGLQGARRTGHEGAIRLIGGKAKIPPRPIGDITVDRPHA